MLSTVVLLALQLAAGALTLAAVIP